jgi:hypothetical protein
MRNSCRFLAIARGRGVAGSIMAQDPGSWSRMGGQSREAAKARVRGPDVVGLLGVIASGEVAVLSWGVRPVPRPCSMVPHSTNDALGMYDTTLVAASPNPRIHPSAQKIWDRHMMQRPGPLCAYVERSLHTLLAAAREANTRNVRLTGGSRTAACPVTRRPRTDTPCFWATLLRPTSGSSRL